uniref:Phytanoyl-CoA dioxygenase n=1 Tax=uncultured Armatimonadetes bacterium TaxID=157466 RepID=A0A6J4JUV6_9BACT|nr:Phytanoyl-CoA dioxygenase [uncultured Armatimonadetes bacterium]
MTAAAADAAGADVSVRDLEVFADGLDPRHAAAVYREHGALVVRGLMKPYLAEIRRDIDAAYHQGVALLPQARHVPGIGWNTPDGALWLPAPEGFARDKQMMIPAVRYNTSGAFFRSAFDEKLLSVVEAIVGPDVELFMDGQCLYKEPVGGHPKNLHQDSAYFEHRYDGPVGVLNYAVDTNLRNGALYVVPGSHRLGQLKHIDTFSHLGLDPDEWPWERALPITGEAGDSIFFHYRCIHGSQENHSDAARPVFIHRYRRPDDYVTVGAATTASREEAEKRAAAATKQNQKGMMVRGFRRYEAEAEG